MNAPGILTFLANHLWQSTIFAAVAAALNLILKDNGARVRHWLWVAASLKFLVPFALLAAVGAHLPWGRQIPTASPSTVLVVSEWNEPFGVPEAPSSALASPTAAQSGLAASWSALLLVLWLVGSVSVAIRSYLRWRQMARLVWHATPLIEGREIKVLRRLEWEYSLPVPMRVKTATSMIEPGLFGIVRSTLLLPNGIGRRMDEPQLAAILSHEICHAKRRDNLWTSFHMAVECAFWFHPLVWWLGTRLIDERERACDEQVLGRGCEPDVYATAMVEICKSYLATPAKFASGVTGSDLKKRIEAIMSDRLCAKLSLGKVLLLTCVGITSVSIPILYGAIHATMPQGATPVGEVRFEAATIKPDNGSSRLHGGKCHGIDSNYAGAVLPEAPPALGTCRYRGSTLMTMMTAVFKGFDTDKAVTGGPDWAASTEFDVLAKAPDPSTATEAQLKEMLQTLLVERFNVRFHREKREVDGYALVPAKGGVKLSDASTLDPLIATERTDNKIPAPTLAYLILDISGVVKAPVLDRTGITGVHDFSIAFDPGSRRFVDPLVDSDPSGTSIFTAVEKQFGLRLQPQKVPVEVIVIDSAEMPKRRRRR